MTVVEGQYLLRLVHRGRYDSVRYRRALIIMAAAAPETVRDVIHAFTACAPADRYPHGAGEPAHPEPGFFLAGMKSYGRAHVPCPHRLRAESMYCLLRSRQLVGPPDAHAGGGTSLGRRGASGATATARTAPMPSWNTDTVAAPAGVGASAAMVNTRLLPRGRAGHVDVGRSEPRPARPVAARAGHPGSDRAGEGRAHGTTECVGRRGVRAAVRRLATPEHQAARHRRTGGAKPTAVVRRAPPAATTREDRCPIPHPDEPAASAQPAALKTFHGLPLSGVVRR